MINKIDHINISVTDLEASKAFYIELLGFHLVTEGILQGEWIDKVVGLSDVSAKFAKLKIPGSETNLELIQYFEPLGQKDPNISQANHIGFRHMAFEVKEIEILYEKLKAAGVKMYSELQTFNGKKLLCYFSGPDDVILEIAEYREQL